MAGDFEAGLREAVRNGFCDIARAGVAGGILFTGIGATTGAGALAGIAIASLSAVTYAAYCGVPPPPDFLEYPDWTGGQCVGVPYVISISFNLILAPKGSNIDVGRVGGTFDAVGAVYTAEAYDTGDTDNDIRIRASWNGGSADVSVVKGVNNDPENPQWGYRNVVVLITRPDNLPDICGNPAPFPRPLEPGDNFYDTDIIYNDGNDIEVNVPINIGFGFPRIDIKGELNMPVNLKFDFDFPIDINGTINFNGGDFNINYNPPGESPAGDDDEPPVTVPPDSEPPPDDVPMPPEPPPETDNKIDKRRIIKAVIVTVTETDIEGTKIFQGENPDIYAPSLGYVAFFIRVGKTGAWTSDIPIKNKRNFIPCPWALGAVDVRGTPRGTAQFILTPVYTKETYNPQFPPESIDP